MAAIISSCGDRRPAALTLLRLAHYWSIIQIGGKTPPGLEGWRISTREFREDLEWAVVVEGEGDMTPAVALLLGELAARGIVIRHARA
jgi:hypothetical protein